MENRFDESVLINLIHYPVNALGIGKRIGIWFQGCDRRCVGCIARHTWFFENRYKKKVSQVINEVKDYIKKNPENIDGITISGGEPFQQPEALQQLLEILKEEGINDIMVYTGFKYEEIKEKYKEILDKIDCLVDGEYKKGETTNVVWKGSENQEMYILTKDEDLRKKYEKYRTETTTKRKLQIMEKGGKYYLLGIPDQKDEEEISNAIG